jgi:hypothetical protein
VSEPQEDLLSRAYAHIRGRQGKRGVALTSSHDSAAHSAARHRFICFPTPAVWHKANPASVLSVQKTPSACPRTLQEITCPQVSVPAGQAASKSKRDPRDWIRVGSRRS